MFGKGIRLFRILGFDVKVDPSWIVLAVLVAWSLSTGLFPMQVKDLSTGTYWMMGIVGAAGLFLSIIVHEFSHSLVARKGGMPMKGITLFIFGGVAEMGDEPPGPRTELLMAVAGPLASIAIALVFYGLYSVGGWIPTPARAVIGYLALINGLLAGFNLVPAYPLDGGRVLRAILWGVKKDIHWATRISSTVGSAFGFFLIFMGILNVLRGNFIGGMWWFLIGMFLNGAARASYQRLVTRRALEGESIRRFMSENPVTVPPSMTVDRFVEDVLYKHHHKMYPVVTEDGRLEGCVSTRDVKNVPKEDWSRRTVDDLSSSCSPDNTIGPDEDATKGLAAMNRSRESRLMVVEGDRLVGVLALKDLLDFLSLKVDLEK
jgi:Zn-dependent protease/predicted transcriptional regulator